MTGGDELIEYGSDFLYADGPSLDDGDLEFLDEMDLGERPLEHAAFPFIHEPVLGVLTRQR